MSDPKDETPEPEILQPDRSDRSGRDGGAAGARMAKEPPVIEGRAEADDQPVSAANGVVSVMAVAVAAGLVGAALVAGGLFQFGFLGSADVGTKVLTEITAKVDANTDANHAQENALSKVEEKLKVASEAADGASAITARLEAIEKQASDVSAALVAAKDENAKRDARLATIEKTMPPADIAQQIERLGAMVKALNTAVDSLAPKIAELDQRVATLEAKKDDPDAAARAALGLALSNLSRAASTSEPFDRELDVVATFLPNEPELAELHAVAAKGVPTQASIEARFPSLVQEVLDAERAAKNEGLWARFVSNAKKLVTVRRTGEISGDETDAVLARMEERVGHDDLSAAIEEAKGLKGPAAEAAKTWVADATARVTTRDLLSSLTADVTKRLSKKADG